MRNRIVLSGMACVAAVAVTACGTGSAGSSGAGLEGQVVWSTYGTGTNTYADTAAVASAITKKEGARVRIITSDTAIGRLAPLEQGQAQVSRTGDEYIFAFEGDYDFATEEWGPQDMRVVWAPVAPHGLMVRDDSGIETFEDLRGKRFPYVTANPSVNNKLTAFLAYGGLTWDDVEKVEVDYSEQPDALKAGELDVLFQQVYGSSLYELESAFPVRWLSMDDSSPEQVQAVEEIAPSTEIGEFTGAPGQEKGEAAKGLIYSVPMVTYADTDTSMVYETVKAIHQNYPAYKNTTATTRDWKLGIAQTMPKEVPFHDGVVKFLKEQGAWTPAAQQKNQELLKRGKALQAEWPKFLEQAGDGNLGAAWTEWKSKHVK